MNKSKIIIFSSMGILILITILLFTSAGNSSEEFNDFQDSPGSSSDKEFTYEDMMNIEKGDLFSTDKKPQEDLYSDKTNSMDKMIQDLEHDNSRAEIDDIYKEEENAQIKKIQRDIERGAYSNSQITVNPSTKQIPNINKPAGITTSKSENPELSKYELRRIAKEKALAAYQNTQEPITTYSSDSSFRAAVYRDHLLLPGDRLTLVLTEDFLYNNILFQKGTKIYAFITINQSRVLLDVNNINNVAIDLLAKDIKDFREGIYSTQAGQLWKQYENEVKDKATNEIANDLTQNVTVPGVRGTVQALTNFFRNKRVRKEEKIPLVNDLEVLFEIVK